MTTAPVRSRWEDAAQLRRAGPAAARRHVLRGRPRDDRRLGRRRRPMITEIGAVKVRGGEVLGEFQTLVNPHTAIPAFIAVLTGITNSMVADAPPIELRAAGVPRVRRGSVLVAHNARSTSASCATSGSSRTSRGPTSRSSTPSRSPAAWSPATRRPTTSCRRWRGVFRVGHDAQPPRARRRAGDGRRAARADGAARQPRASTPSRSCRPILARSPPPSAASATSPTGSPTPRASTCSATSSRGCSTSARRKDLRKRVRSYFTASETRSRIGEMVRLASSVTGIECATPLEAEVRELRLIAEHKPSYNRRSRFPEKVTFVKLTREPWPRLSLVKRVLDDDADYLGPFSSRSAAEKLPGRPARDVPDPPVLRQVRPPAVPRRPASSPSSAAACRPATAASTRAPTPPWSGSCATRCCGIPTTSSSSSTRRWRRSPSRSGSRRPASIATGWPRSSGRRPAPSG